jgi:hypothetical protein
MFALSAKAVETDRLAKPAVASAEYFKNVRRPDLFMHPLHTNG